MKLPKLPKLPSLKSLHLPSRITMERLLIVSAAALVVVLAVRGGQQTQTAMQQTDFTPRCQHPNHRGRIAGCRNDRYRLLV